MGYALGRDGYGLAAAGVAPHAWGAVVDGETAKTPDLDAMPTHQGIAHGVQNGLDGVLGIAVGELAKAGGQFFNEV